MDFETDSRDEPSQLEARYANFFQTGHNAIEFLIEFGQSYAGDARPLLHTRIVTSPAYAKNLLALLSNSIETYESEHGPIPEP